MNENGTKKREWVKNAVIVFLVVMLLLTFFSNSIMNYSLPEVAAQYIQSGTVTAKIRGTGVVESGDPYNVKIGETRKVESVEVKVGDTVQIGDVLCFLSGEESSELEAAREALEAAQMDFELALLTGDISTSIMNSAGTTQSMETYRNQIIAAKNVSVAAQAEVDAAQEKVDEWQKKYDAYTAQISMTPSNNADVTEETKAYNTAKTALENAGYVKTNAENQLSAIEAQIAQQNELISISQGDEGVLANLQIQRVNANQAVIDATTAYNNAQLALTKAETALNNKKATGDTTGTIANLTIQQAAVKVELDNAQTVLAQKQAALENAQADLTGLVGDIQTAISLGSKYDAIIKAQEQVAKLTAEAAGSQVAAPIAGTITSVNVQSGLETPSDGILFTMQPEGKGYTLSFSVTNEQATRLSVGDQAELVNAWRYDDMQVILTSIRPDTTNPGSNKLLTFDVTGSSVVAGQTLSVSVGQKSASYDMIVPNSAIREDNNGKFILIVESKSSPIGTRYTATRVDVEVLASDDTQSAISGALYGYEFVITTSTKPVEAGTLIRLAD